LAVPVAYWPLLGGFAWELFAFKTEVDAFGVSAVADLAELVLPCNATDSAVWACVALHSGTFLAGDTANTDFHKLPSPCFKQFMLSVIYV
jgi:hypothetical protein